MKLRIPALSLRQPWAWLVVHGGKTIENRRWNTKHRGVFLIHASKGMTATEYFDAIQFTAKRGHAVAGRIPTAKALERGGIIGVAQLASVHLPEEAGEACRMPGPVHASWHMHEQYGYRLIGVRPTPFIPCVGLQRFFYPPDEVVELALREAVTVDLKATDRAAAVARGDIDQ